MTLVARRRCTIRIILLGFACAGTASWLSLLAPVPVTLDKEAWGFDHGSWGVLIKMYPDADIPMVQLSIDSSKPAAWHSKWGANWQRCEMKE